MKIGKYYSEMPGWAKGVVAVIIVGGIAFATWKIYKLVKGIGEGAGEAFRDLKEKGDVKAELAESAKKEPPSYSDTEYENFANTLFAAMDGAGTDYDKIESVFMKMKNKTDVLSVINFYGIRKLNSGIWWGNDKTGNLAECLADELGQQEGILNYLLKKSELENLNDILASKNIDYKF